MMQIRHATKAAAKLRFGIIGPAGAGKTFTALRIALGLQAGPVVVIDTERGSASKYADLFTFDVLDDMPDFSPGTFVQAIKAAEQAGAAVIIIDSLSHAWMGKGGALEMVDAEAARSKSSNSFGAWRAVTPQHNAMVDAILRSTAHVIVTLRSKTEWVIDQQERGGRTVSVPRKIGLAPVQRDGLEYEFDVVGDIDGDNTFCVTKTRCPALAGAVIRKPGEDLALTLRTWLAGTTPEPPPPPTVPVVHVPAPVFTVTTPGPHSFPIPAPNNGIEMAQMVLAPLALTPSTPPEAINKIRSLVRELGKASTLPTIAKVCGREIHTADEIPTRDLAAVCNALEALKVSPAQAAQ